MQPLLVLPVLVFVLLLSLFLLVLRRAGRFVSATRDAERFRRQIDDLSGRAETSLAEICGRIDAVRRGQVGADQVADDVLASLDAVGLYAAEARGFHPPVEALAIQAEIVAELERAGRALEMIEHGREIQASPRSGGREIEAQTAIKRGYLNVLHARESIAHQARLMAAMTPNEASKRFQRRNA